MSDQDAATVTVVVVGTAEAGASGTMAILDVLSSVGRGWQRLHDSPVVEPRFRPRLLTLDGEPYRQPNGTTITPHGRLSDDPRPDIVIVPELILSRHAPLPETYSTLATWIRQAYEGGAIVASVCSGTMLLALTGLLDGKEATTHWGFCDALARRYPKVVVRKERILVPTGEGHRIITAGGASSWYDLLLYLVARFCGSERAREVAKTYLVQAHNEGQLPYAGLAARRQHGDQLVAQAQLWLADNYGQASPVAALAARSGLTERGFFKRFRTATGLSPMEYVQVLRIEEAKHLLETTERPVDDIASDVGYVEPASFRRLFRRMVGLAPSEYRRRNLLPQV